MTQGMTPVIAEALALIPQVPQPPEGTGYVGATPEQLAAVADQLGFPLPASLHEWLTHCNGIMAGPGGLYGAGHPQDGLSIASTLDMYPEWTGLKWIPVAGDGNGDVYVVDASRKLANGDIVLFIDTAEDGVAPAYAVASSLGRFLVFLLRSELGERRWPFDEAFVAEHDPDVLRVPAALLPWNT